jgi:DNA-binding beta-propeller fold protein YncE
MEWSDAALAEYRSGGWFFGDCPGCHVAIPWPVPCPGLDALPRPLSNFLFGLFKGRWIMKTSILVPGLSLALFVFSGSDLLAQASKQISASTLYGSGEYTYELVEEWAKLPQGWTFSDGAGIAIDSSDHVYILSRGTHPVTKWDRDGIFLGNWGGNYFRRAHGATIGPDGNIWCADDGDHTVTKFTPEGQVLMTLGTPGKSSPFQSGLPFNRPTGVSVSPAGEVYVSDGYGNARVHKFASDGKLLFSWGEPGTGPGQFRLVHHVWLDTKGRVWVCDRENNRIQLFDTNGTFLTQWTDVSRPTAIFLDKEGVVYVAELNARISIFDNNGKLLARWGDTVGGDPWKQVLVAPHAIAVDSRGDLYVAQAMMTIGGIEKGTKVVQKYVKRK